MFAHSSTVPGHNNLDVERIILGDNKLRTQKGTYLNGRQVKPVPVTKKRDVVLVETGLDNRHAILKSDRDKQFTTLRDVRKFNINVKVLTLGGSNTVNATIDWEFSLAVIHCAV